MKSSKMNRKILFNFFLSTITLLLFSGYVLGIEVNFKEHEEFFEDPEGMAWEQSLRVPIVKGAETKVVKRINASIQKLLSRFKCNPKAELFFTGNVKYQNDSILSFKYNASYMCRTMPGPSSYDGGITFDISTGRIIKLKNEVKNQTSYDALSKGVLKKLLPVLKSKVKNYKACDNPRFSGEYYIENENIVFTEFFSEHYKVFCEVNVNIPVYEISSFFKSDTELFNNKGNPNIKILSAEYKKSIRWYRCKNNNEAIQVLKPLLGSRKYLDYEISNNEVLSIVNDYAFFLEQGKIYDESIEILNHIVKKVPGRVVAYINLGDAYYGNKDITNSKRVYQKYVDLMKKAGKEKRIPKRVYARLK